MRGGGNKIGYFILAKNNIRCSREVQSRGAFRDRISLVIKHLLKGKSCGKSPIDCTVNLCEVYEKIRVRIRKKSVSGSSTSLPVSS